MIKCIAIDDEPLALKQIVTYIGKIEKLNLVAQFDNAIDALKFLKTNPVDLLFVDIEMPDLSGMDFVRSLDTEAKVIFTTAYPEYAAEGFKVDAADYLLKPIAFDDFMQSVQKTIERYFTLEETQQDSISSDPKFLFIKSEYKLLRIEYSEIEFIESQREYVFINRVNGEQTKALLSMQKLENYLPSNVFMRVHRSFIVNLNKIVCIERNRIVFGKNYIPISDQYKDSFTNFLNNNFLK